MGMEVAVERAIGRIRVTRVVCGHDCGLMINPECVQSQLEGNILQTLSRDPQRQLRHARPTLDEHSTRVRHGGLA